MHSSSSCYLCLPSKYFKYFILSIGTLTPTVQAGHVLISFYHSGIYFEILAIFWNIAHTAVEGTKMLVQGTEIYKSIYYCTSSLYCFLMYILLNLVTAKKSLPKIANNGRHKRLVYIKKDFHGNSNNFSNPISSRYFCGL